MNAVHQVAVSSERLAKARAVINRQFEKEEKEFGHAYEFMRKMCHGSVRYLDLDERLEAIRQSKQEYFNAMSADEVILDHEVMDGLLKKSIEIDDQLFSVINWRFLKESVRQELFRKRKRVNNLRCVREGRIRQCMEYLHGDAMD